MSRDAITIGHDDGAGRPGGEVMVESIAPAVRDSARQ
jgi:hypothetical protein